MDSKKLIESKEVLDLTVQGKTVSEISNELNVSTSTVSNIKKSEEYRELRKQFNEVFTEKVVVEYRKGCLELQNYIPQIFKNLQVLASSENEKIALDANKFLFDRYQKLINDIAILDIQELKDTIEQALANQ